MVILRKLTEFKLLQSGINLSSIKEMSERDVLEYAMLADVIAEVQNEAMEKK
jgi:hypothetical protein